MHGSRSSYTLLVTPPSHFIDAAPIQALVWTLSAISAFVLHDCHCSADYPSTRRDTRISTTLNMFAGIVAAVATLVAAQNTQASHSSDCASLVDRLRSPSESARLAIGGAELALACADAACFQ